MVNTKKNIILIGGGGHCISIIDIIENGNEFNILGILDSNNFGKNILGYKILGDDSLINNLVNDNTYFLITVGQIKTCSPRERIYKILKENNAKIATVISPLAYVSRHAKIGEGSVVMNHATVNAQSTIGRNCIINTMSNIEHGVLIGDFCHISTCSVINGDSQIGQRTFVGSNATISHGISIKEDSVISAGKFVK